MKTMLHSTSRIAPLAAALVVVAACTEAPMAPVAPEAAPSPATQADAIAEADTGDETPRFVPYDTPPRLENAREVSRTLQALYPVDLREAGVGGVANVWLYIDETGTVQDAQLNRSSGVEEIDAAALALAGTMVFEPARHREKPVAVWVAIPVTFSVGG